MVRSGGRVCLLLRCSAHQHAFYPQAASLHLVLGLVHAHVVVTVPKFDKKLIEKACFLARLGCETHLHLGLLALNVSIWVEAP